MFLSLISCAPQAQADEVCIHDRCYSVELAIDQATQSKGLMFRESMPADHGMLFVFPASMRHSFWMKNTLIPLDMIFLDHARRVVHIEKGAKPCTGEPCRYYVTPTEALYVLELNAGQAEEAGMAVGDQFVFKLNLKRP